ncbi:MAG TPA: YceI family protein [Cytophagaceae bacterium]|jgi:polyisoprenoid-binding protein YceI|nr:YceI family protein [Cytophagaceae bacterium]
MKGLKKILIIAFAIVVSFLPFNLDAVNVPAITKESSITYKLHHKFHNVAATSKAIKYMIDYDPVKSQINSVTAVADVTTFDSGNGNLDSHAMEVVEALKYPKVTFKSTNIIVSGNTLNITGILTFHGVSKEIFFKANMIRKDNTIEVDGNFPLSIDAFKVERPSLMFVKLDDKMEMSFHASFEVPAKN